MSHRNHDNNFWLILILCLLFPEVAAAIGFGYIFLWILGILLFLIYTFWIPIAVVAILYLIFRSNSNDKSKIGDVEKKTSIPPTKLITFKKKLNKKELPIIESSPYVSGYHELDSGDDEEVREIMENHDLDRDEAEHVWDLMNEEGLDEDDAVELKDDL